LNGICTLVRIPEPYKEWQRVASWPYGTVVYDLDLSPDGMRTVMSVGEPSGKQDVRVFQTNDLLSGRMEPFARFDFGTAVPNNFVFSPNGRYLYGSTYYTGASNIFRYDLKRKSSTR
jgi:Tol biopolymer transport system component